MSMRDQSGFIQIIIILLLLAGLGVGVYLVQKQTSLKSHASIGETENSLSLVAYPKDSQPITQPQESAAISVKPGDLFTADILVRTPTTEVNLISAKLKFDNNLLQVVDKGLEIDTKDPFVVKTVTDSSFDNNTGMISIIGGIPAPGYKSNVGQSGLLARITFKALNAGETKIDFQSGSAMYKNADSKELELVIQRSLSVKTSATSPQTTSNTSDKSDKKEITINIVPGLNYIALPIQPDITPEQFKDKSKCRYLLEVSGNPDATDILRPNAKLALEKWYPQQSTNTTILTEIKGGKTYVARCDLKTSFTLSGKITSMVKFMPGQQNIAVPFGYSKTAKEFLREISDNSVVCTNVSKFPNDGSGAAAQRIWDTAPQDFGVVQLASGNPNALITYDNAYFVQCASRNDPNILKLAKLSEYTSQPSSNQISTPTISTSKKVSNPMDFFALWFDKDKTNLDRSGGTSTTVLNVITKGQLAGYIKSKFGKMKKLEYSFFSCSATNCQSKKPVFRTVFDGIQNQNPVSFAINFEKGTHIQEESGVINDIIFRLEDDQGNVFEPVELTSDGILQQSLSSSTSFSIMIGGGIGTPNFQFVCEETMKYKSCKKDWIGQPSWYKPGTTPSPTLVATPVTQKSGDINKDNKVDLIDLSLLMGKWGQKGSTALEADINNDGTVNSFDLLIQRSKLVQSGIIKQ